MSRTRGRNPPSLPNVGSAGCYRTGDGFMLYISFSGFEVNREWHVGEPVPTIPSGTNVVKFQADGDELDLILSAMRKTTHVRIGKDGLEV